MVDSNKDDTKPYLYLIKGTSRNTKVHVGVFTERLFIKRVPRIKILAEIKRTQSRGKDQKWKINKHNKEHKVTKVTHTE